MNMKHKNKLIAIGIVILVLIVAFNFTYITSKLRSKIINDYVDDSPGNAPIGTYPIILLHGFNPVFSSRVAEWSFKEMQDQLSGDLGYRDVGLMTEEMGCAELRYTDKPIVVRATYFEKNELVGIEEYTNNLDLIISKVLYCTGAEKVDLVTHSMGGIVTRNYIKTKNSETIHKFIMMGTPNHGGLYNVAEGTHKLVENGESKVELDFIQLSEDHNFMKNLNSDNETFSGINYYTIAGNVDGEGDGVVLESSVKLEGVPHLTVSCEHISLKHPSLCPEAYSFVKEILMPKTEI